MMRIAGVILIWGLLMATASAPCSAAPVEVDQAEVLRLGDLVQHVDGAGSESGFVLESRFVAAMAPPEADDAKWFISVISMQGCAGCERLKKEWGTNAWLLALADPNNPEKSWAHYNVYDKDDASQAFRFEGIRITTFPTILVQPPRSGRYGDPRTVVFQGVYGGDPERLARDISSAIRRYLEKLDAAPSRTTDRYGQVGVDPPWQPSPKVPTPAPLPVLPEPQPIIPPPEPQPAPLPDSQPTPLASASWGTAGTVAATSLITLVLSFGLPLALRTYRNWRIESGRRPLLTDAQFQALLAALSAANQLQAAKSGAATDASNHPIP